MAKKSTKSTDDISKQSSIKDDIIYPKIIDRRLQQIRFQLEDQKVESICIVNISNIRYITNFSGLNALVFVHENEVHFITDDRYEDQIKTELFNLPNLHTHITRDPWNYIANSEILKDIQSIAFEAEYMPYAEAVEIRNIIRPVKFKPATNMVTRFMQTKGPEEISYIKKSLEISNKVYEYLLSFIKPGMTEIDVATEIGYQARKFGSEGDTSEIIVVSGNRGSLVFGNPSDKKIKKNDLIIVDYGARINGFGSDISRTISMGKVSKEQKAMYQTIRKAQNAALAEVRPGMNGKHLDHIVRNIIKNDGFGDSFKHTSGHGIGIAAIESPLISNYLNHEIVPEDAILGIEPGIYASDKFGIRSEQVMLVKNYGGELLLAAPDEIAVI
ncbi:MAG TPA: Xaa-Pro peptidase family protein [Candidatus Kapabacteria bacterium]|nr:Xaa-Pro peptidase family protein [Candidatus Kapabacteria bacterium]